MCVCARECVCVYVGGLGEVMALMGGAVAGDQEELHGRRRGRGLLMGSRGECCPLLVEVRVAVTFTGCLTVNTEPTVAVLVP